MTVSVIASVASGAIERSLGSGGSRYANSVRALIASGSDSKQNSYSSDVSRIGDAIARQAQAAALRGASLNIAQASSQLSTAEGGVEATGDLLGRLQQLASRASADGISDAERANLSTEFQAVLNEMDRIARDTRFQGKALLDGSLSASDLGLAAVDADGTEAGIPNLSSRALFDGASLRIDTQAGAKAVRTKITAAEKVVTAVQNNIQAFARALEIGAAAVESALYNQDAASSVLTEQDIISRLLGGGDATTRDPLAAQIGRLPNDILSLLGE